MIVLAMSLAISVVATIAMASDTEEIAVEERVYQSGYEDSVIDLIKVKKAGDGTDIDGDAIDGNASDLEQVRNFIVGKTSAFYRTQGVKYEFNEETKRYQVISEQSCSAGIAKAEGTLTILSAYDDGKNGEATVTTVAEGAFSDCTDVTTAVMPTVTTLGANAFQGCSNLKTAVVVNNFSLKNAAFPDEEQSVDICVAGINEPTLDMSKNAGLSGKVYHKNENGACDTWTFDDEGAIVKAQHKHTFGDDGVCTNEKCAVESIDGLTFEKNYFEPRTAQTLTVEKVDAYEDSSKLDKEQSGITEMNVAKVTTVGTYADFVIRLPEDVQDTLTVRILIPSSSATYIRFRTVGNTGECNFGGEIEDLAANSALATENTDVWLDYTFDYSNTNRAYKDRLTMLVQGQAQDAVNTFYVAYAVNTEKIEDKLAAELKSPYLADFSSSLYETTAGKNMIKGRTAASVTAQKVDSYTDKNGNTEKNVLKITTVAASSSSQVADFVLNLPKSVSNRATVRILFKDSDAKWLAFRNIINGVENYPNNEAKVVPATGLKEEQTDVWMNVPIDYSNTDEAYKDRLAMLIQQGAAGASHTIYIAYVAETDQIQTALAADLEEGYVADFSSSLYLDYVKKGGFGTIETTWLPSYKGEEGVVKVVMDAAKFSSSRGICEFTLPKSYDSSKYTMRLCIGENTDLKQIGACTSGGGWNNGCFYDGVDSYTKEEWKDITVKPQASDGYNKAKIGIMGFTPGTKLEFYISWIKEAN